MKGGVITTHTSVQSRVTHQKERVTLPRQPELRLNIASFSVNEFTVILIPTPSMDGKENSQLPYNCINASNTTETVLRLNADSTLLIVNQSLQCEVKRRDKRGLLWSAHSLGTL